ncbi:MAG: DUF188 domain-containing protein [Treponema sp.]|nr:DUF188 domain-containing protein [Treponema sp.]
MRILIDADSCPKAAREMVLRFASRLKIIAIFYANRKIPGIPETQMVISSNDEGAADKLIIKSALKDDLILTRDLPLAESLVEAGNTVMDDRGRVFTCENIRELRSIRDFTVGLAESGLGIERTASYGKKELSSFANSLDRELTRLKSQSASG